MSDNIIIIKKGTHSYPIFSEQLENIGYEAEKVLEFASIEDFVYSGKAALIVFFCIDTYDLLLDPGFEKSLAGIACLPIVALSSIPHTEHMEMAMLAGMDDYLLAGAFNEHVLNKTIICAVARKRKQIDAAQSHDQKLDRESEALDCLNDAFYTVDNDWNFTFINKECERLYNIKREHLIGTNWRNLFAGSRAKKFYQEYEKAVEQQSSVHFKAFAPNANKWLQVNAYPGKNGLSIFHRDISDQKLLEDKISEEKQNLLAIINNTIDLVWSVDKDLKIISANDAFKKFIYRLSGIHPETGICALWHTIDPAILDRWKANYIKALDGSFNIIDEENINGLSFYTETFFSPINGIDGGPVGVSCFSRDISKQRERSLQIQSQHTRLLEIARMQSHQVRGPISTILGLAQFFNASDHSDPINTQVINGIVETTNELDGIIREIVKRTYEIVPEDSLVE